MRPILYISFFISIFHVLFSTTEMCGNGTMSLVQNQIYSDILTNMASWDFEFNGADTISRKIPVPALWKYHPLKQLKLGEDDVVEFCDSRGEDIIARQQLYPIFHRNGAAYAFTRNCLLEQQTLRGKRTAELVIEESMISIDTIEEFEQVEHILQLRGRDGLSNT